MSATAQAIFILYRFYAVDDALLYVGLTRNPAKRFEKHAYDKSWWCQVKRIEIETYKSLTDLRDAERAAIATEKPVHNIRMNAATLAQRSRNRQSDPLEETVIDGLCGRFFHSFRDLEQDEPYASIIRGRAVQWQGRILEEIANDVYLVELFSWWDGVPNDGRQVVMLDAMLDWQFYDSALEMQMALPCGECHDTGDYCRGQREFYSDLRQHGLGIHLICNGCRKRYPGFANYKAVIWKDGRPCLQ